MVPGLESLIPIIESGAKAAVPIFLKKLAKSNLFKLKSSDSEVDLHSALAEHLESSFDKSAFVETILRDNREKLSDIYVEQSFFREKYARISQKDTIAEILKQKAVIIQGTGGSGKSMFVRYLWLYFFSNIEDRIPLFIELRTINQYTHDNLAVFLYHTAITQSKKLTQAQFDEALAEGRFAIFFDGFDELSQSSKDEVDRKIQLLKQKNPKSIFIVTSRPDERFAGWQHFDCITVAPLNKIECMNVLSRAPYDEAEKSRLIKNVDKGLYESYRSFFENPLLCYMTLVTFSYNPNFTDKMFEFYEMAFDALYYRHDLLKGGTFKRDFFTSLSKTEFQRLLSYFCLRSYFNEKISFSENELLNYIQESIAIEKAAYSHVDAQNFISDLNQSICIMKKDGLEYTFTHRKLQEYFAAFCLSRVSDRSFNDKMITKLAVRYSDDVMQMVYDLNQNLFRERYIL